MKKILFLVFLIFLNYGYVNSQEVVIKFKINNQIITNLDIKKEAKYLSALNTQLKNLNESQLELIATESLITETIKKIELKKYQELSVEHPGTQGIIDNLYEVLNLKNKVEFKNYLAEKGLTVDFVKNKINIENLWNLMIYQNYKSLVKINESLINSEIKSLKSSSKEKKFLLSEIFFYDDGSISIEEKIEKINQSINEIGFKNTATIYSKSDSAKLGGNIGWIREKELSKIILKKIEKIEKGQISKPIKLNSNYLILKIEDIKTETSIINEKQLFEKIVSREKDRQLKLFSKNYFNKIKINLDISEI
mgnify:CR=1 FL=1|tara:strand:+ start:573 stop:1496 length:924 start_codon:yes stop_codon:yes gene_type:complete